MEGKIFEQGFEGRERGGAVEPLWEECAESFKGGVEFKGSETSKDPHGFEILSRTTRNSSDEVGWFLLNEQLLWLIGMLQSLLLFCLNDSMVHNCIPDNSFY